MAAIEIAQARGLTAADLAGATLSQAGGALVVRLADGRVIVVPGFFPHEQPPLPPDAAPPGAIVLPIDAYYAVVAGGDPGSGGAPTLPGNEPDALAAIVTGGADPTGGFRGAPSSLTSSLADAGSGATGGLAGLPLLASLGAGGNSGGTGAPTPGSDLIFGNGADGSGSSPASGSGAAAQGGGASGGGTAGGTGPAGPQPPSVLAGLPLAGGGTAPTVGTVAGTTFSAPQVGAVAGSTGGQGGIEDFVFVPGTYEVSAVVGGFSIRDTASGATVLAEPEFGARLLIGTPPDNAVTSQVTLADPQNWLFIRTDHDVTLGQLLRHDVGGYEQAFMDFAVSRSQRLIGPIGAPPVFGYVDVTGSVPAGVDRYALVASLVGPDVGVVLGDPHDPNLAFAFGAGEVNTLRPLVVFSDQNDYDFVGVDGSKFHNLDTFDAVNGVATLLNFDRAFLDSMDLLPLAGQTAANGRFVEIRADAIDQVAFADPQNWNFDGITAAGNVQYRALGTATPLLVEMPTNLAAKPVYHYAGGAGDETVALPDDRFGALDGAGGIDALRLLSGSFDFTALAAGQSVAGFEFIDAGGDATANTIVVDKAFVAADGGTLTLLGGANDRALIADLATEWTQLETFTASPTGVATDFVRFQTRDGSATLNVQAELAQDLPIFRIGGAGDDRLTVAATARTQTIDGGAGFDLLVPEGPGAIDLTALAPGSTVRNVEALDLRGQGDNAITFDDVFAGDATVDGILSVLGDAGDTLTLTGGWTKTGSFAVGADTYDRWQATTPLGVAVTAFVDSQIQTQAA